MLRDFVSCFSFPIIPLFFFTSGVALTADSLRVESVDCLHEKLLDHQMNQQLVFILFTYQGLDRDHQFGYDMSMGNHRLCNLCQKHLKWKIYSRK